MNFKTTMALLVLLLVVGSYFVLVESRSDTTYDREQRVAAGGDQKGTPLFADDDLSADSVAMVSIEKRDGAVTLAKEGADWWQTEPVRCALNSWDARKLPQMAADLRYVEKFKPGTFEDSDPEKLQLAPKPLAMVTLSIEDGDAGKPTPVTLHLGKKVGGHGFVMIAGDPLVYVVGSDLHDHVLDASVNDWRKTSIDGVKEGQADQVRVVHDGEGFELAKNSDGDWSLVAPRSGRVDRKAVEDLLNDVDGIFVSKFIVDRPEDLSIYGLDTPAHVVEIRKPTPEAPQTRPADDRDDEPEDATADPSRQPTHYTLRIGAPVDLKKEQFFATWDQDSTGGDVVFSITSSTVEKLEKTIDDMRDPRITTIDASDISQLKIDAADQEDRYLVRNEDRWQFEPGSDPGFAADDAETARLVTAITGAKAVGYKPHYESGGAVAAAVTLGATARPDPDVLKIYTDSGGESQRYVIIRNNETTGHLIEADDVSGLFGPRSDLRERIVLGIPRDSVEGVTVRRPDGIVFEFERRLEAPGGPGPTTAPATDAQVEGPTTLPSAESQAAGAWQLVGHEDFESSALSNLLDGLMPLRATRWLPGDPAAESASKHVHRVVVKARDDDDVTLLFDVASRRATVAGIDMPFEVSESIAEAVDAEFRHRTALPFSTMDVETISVHRGAATLVVKNDDSGDFVGNGGEKIDQSAAGGLFDTLAGLRVDRYLPADAPTIDAGVTITVTLKDTQSHVVSVAAGEQKPHRITIGSAAYTISSDIFEKLTAPLIEKAEDGE